MVRTIENEQLGRQFLNRFEIGKVSELMTENGL
jgi:hypothetical protein